MTGVTSRREAREEALGVLYEGRIGGESAAEVLARRIVAPDPYAAELVRDVEERRPEIDALLDEHLVGWRVDRLALVDRLLAEMAVCELLCRPEVPAGVVLAELVALADQYGGDESARFLNGVVGAIARRVRPDTPGA